VYGVDAISPNDAWLVGSYQGQGPSRTLVEHWDGQQWSIDPSPNVGQDFNHLRGIAAIASNDVWAVGDSGATLIEHWDGQQWSIVPSPNPISCCNALNAVAAVSYID